jgi:PilZ domain-containing protein
MTESGKQYKRLYPRRKVSVSCQLMWQEDQAFGDAVDVSLGGLTILLHRPVETNKEGVVIHIPQGEGIVLRARPVHKHSLARGTLVGFEIERIESGKQEWQRICYVPSW